MDIEHLLLSGYTALQLLYGQPHTQDTRTDLWCLTSNVVFEAGHQSLEGKLAIIEVTDTRRKSKLYPNTYCDVVYQRKQFSWTLIDEEYLPKPSDSDIMRAAQLAASYLDPSIDLPKTSVYGATHFINPEVADYIPEWYYVYEYLGTVDDHEFFRRPNRGEKIPVSKLKPRPVEVVSE